MRPNWWRSRPILEGAGIPVKGVLTHAGSSYDCASVDAIRAMAEQERAAAVHAAARLRAAGMACPVVSVGSTPTALFAQHLEGVTEVRAGVFVFFDLVMAGLNVCSLDDIAAVGAGHRDRAPARQGLDPAGRGLDGHVARPRHRQPAGGPGLRPGVRPRWPAARRTASWWAPTRSTASWRTARASWTARRTCPWAPRCESCRTTPVPPQPSIDRYQVVGPDRQVTATWPRFNGW